MLLSNQWILTAAHCLRKRLYVRAGEHDLTEVEDTEQQERVAMMFEHPNYDPVTVESDIALLKMRIPFELSPDVQPICLPHEEDELPFYARATIRATIVDKRVQALRYNLTNPFGRPFRFLFHILRKFIIIIYLFLLINLFFVGWGTRTSESVYVENVLLETNVPIIPPKECRNAYKDVFISDHMICAGFAGGRVDSCRGDSGGPLMHTQKDGTWAAYGVTSFGEGCGEKGKFGVYANVVSHLSWIKSVIKNYN
ncbi:vitamin K-dependent protein C-like [Stegodyphus dumicola]|uniref:vitamin K-dependent protein C-like n=1 Tax=Stegodyphus dumicola TaxID=202533 RepID=UPI0015B2DD6C|nr:vitamin K-dependent protein C-like [Stegodyphus dumicola]